MNAPWTPRERALYKALEEAKSIGIGMATAAWNAGQSGASAWMASEREARVRFTEHIHAALADQPPPDPRDAALVELELHAEECKRLFIQERAKNEVTTSGISALIEVYEAADRLAEECDEDTWKVEESRMKDLHSALEKYEKISENGGGVATAIARIDVALGKKTTT